MCHGDIFNIQIMPAKRDMVGEEISIRLTCSNVLTKIVIEIIVTKNVRSFQFQKMVLTYVKNNISTDSLSST